jgi:uncharacterized protein (DUF4213/DUF364 family)
MRIINDIIASLEKTDTEVTDISRGTHWTSVTSRGCGLADAMKSFDPASLTAEPARKGISALKLAELALSSSLYEASTGMAAINSLIECPPERCSELDGLGIVLGMAEGRNISIIGRFPYPPELAGIARSLKVMENKPAVNEYPFERAADFLPDSDIIIISSTTLIDHNFEWMISLCRKGSTRMFLGPGTPMTEVLFDHGLDILSGSLVTDRELLLEKVRGGADFREIRKSGAVRFVTLTKNAL